MKLNPHKTGLALGLAFGLFHLLWAVLVLLGFAQTLIGFALSIHFLNNPFQIQPFDVTIALILIVVTAGIGYVIGKIFALVWNKVQK